MKLKVLFITIIVLLSSATVYAQDIEPPDPQNIEELLAWVIGPGLAAIVGWLMSKLCEVWPWFNGIDSMFKEFLSDGLALAIPVIVAALLKYVPVPVFTEINAAWPLIMALTSFALLKWRYYKKVKPSKAA